MEGKSSCRTPAELGCCACLGQEGRRTSGASYLRPRSLELKHPIVQRRTWRLLGAGMAARAGRVRAEAAGRQRRASERASVRASLTNR